MESARMGLRWFFMRFRVVGTLGREAPDICRSLSLVRQARTSTRIKPFGGFLKNLEGSVESAECLAGVFRLDILRASFAKRICFPPFYLPVPLHCHSVIHSAARNTSQHKGEELKGLGVFGISLFPPRGLSCLPLRDP